MVVTFLVAAGVFPVASAALVLAVSVSPVVPVVVILVLVVSLSLVEALIFSLPHQHLVVDLVPAAVDEFYRLCNLACRSLGNYLLCHCTTVTSR